MILYDVQYHIIDIQYDKNKQNFDNENRLSIFFQV